MKMMKLINCFLLCMMSFALPLFAAKGKGGDEPRKDDLGRDYYLYLPKIDPKKTYWLVVGAHGNNGRGQGAAGMAKWTERGDCIVVGPSFPQGFQGLAEQSDEQLLKLKAKLDKEFRLYPKMFVTGFSAGAQFSHRFALKHPAAVCGVSAHSAGSWSTGGQFGAINPEAAGIPYSISCGDADTGLSMPSYPMGRYEWFKAYRDQLIAAKFFTKAVSVPKVGHSPSPQTQALTEETFLLATTGLSAVEMKRHGKDLAALAKFGGKMESASARALLQKLKAVKLDAKALAAAGWTVSDEQRRKSYEAALEAISGTKP
ncbi:MAG: hypothetical protein RL095_1344 [Verrucomicrobiota bacterium]